MTAKYGTKPLLEQRVVMSSLGRDDVYGTSDCNFLVPEQGIVEITDYKNGYGVVEVQDNPQTIGYAIAALDTFQMWDQVHTVRNTIVQPNGNHVDGPVRTAVYPVRVLHEWREKFRRSVALAEDKSQKPKAGEHCYYCPAQANCRARIEWVLDHAYVTVPFEELSIPELELIYRERLPCPEAPSWIQGCHPHPIAVAPHHGPQGGVGSAARKTVARSKTAPGFLRGPFFL